MLQQLREPWLGHQTLFEQPGKVCHLRSHGAGREAAHQRQTFGGLNPCPLKACCGQCGISEELGNPGVCPKGNNRYSIICDRDIMNNDEVPASFITSGITSHEIWIDLV